MIQTEKIFSHHCACCGHFWLDQFQTPSEICPKCQNGTVVKYKSVSKLDNVDVCEKCPNDQRNGGTGICNCALPSMRNPTMC